MAYNKISGDILNSIISIVGEDAIVTQHADLEKYSHDETEDLSYYPEVVVKPHTTEEISDLLKICNEHMIPVTPRGAGTGLAGGALPVLGGLLISMERFNKILNIDEENLQATVEPGVITEEFMNAVAEKGLLVLDCTAYGKAGHAAREEGDNAIYKAIKDIEWFKNYRFDKVSELIGPNKMSVTIINAGTQHNVIPPECKFTVDVRVNELYTFEEVIDIIRQNIQSEITPRSLRLRSTNITLDHLLVKAGIELGRTYYGSPTTSDKALMPFPALKIGPGDSARSHSADEFIFVDEIKNGIELYIELLNKIVF